MEEKVIEIIKMAFRLGYDAGKRGISESELEYEIVKVLKAAQKYKREAVKGI